MTGIKNWLFGVIAVCALLSLAYAFVPKGKFRTMIRCAGGIILLFALLQPILQLDWAETFPSYSDWKWELEGENEVYQNLQMTELESIIGEKTAAYIEEKAATLGVVCHAQVKCIEHDGVPFPSEVVLDIAYVEKLSKQIADDLDIPVGQQHWQEVTE